MFQTIIKSITRLIQVIKARFTKPEDRIDTYAMTREQADKVKVNSSITRPSLYRTQKKTKRQMQQISRRINR